MQLKKDSVNDLKKDYQEKNKSIDIDNNVADEINYYTAYEKRYSQVYNEKMMWSSNQPTPDVINFFNEYNISKNNKVLDLGCGEGRDAIYFLDKGYNVFAVDYSKTVIEMCNKITQNKYKDKFRNFDLIKDKMEEKFDFIYSVAVLHLFITKEHRDTFLTFIKEHLKENGRCLLCVLGDGVESYSSNIEDSFKNVNRIVMNNGTKLNIAATSCRVVNWEELESEIINNNLMIEKKWISTEIPEFTNSMCVIVRR